MRAAIYYSPAAEHPVTRLAAEWLGRDAYSGAATAPARVFGVAEDERERITAEPRRYGFHATLKAPFALADGSSLDELGVALADFAAGHPGAKLGRLEVAALGGFLALVPAAPAPEAEELAAELVRRFDRFRAPLSAFNLERRRAAGLTPAEDAHLVRWGYPYVFELFRFHMTLTGQLQEPQRWRVMKALQERFNPLLEAPLKIDALTLFVEREPGAPFVVHRRFQFGAPQEP